jgi:hypothetical protein
VESQNTVPGDQIESILKRVQTLQNKSGYDGNYDQWIKEHLPKRVENLKPIN